MPYTLSRAYVLSSLVLCWFPTNCTPLHSSTEDERKLSGTSPRPVIPKRPTKLVVLYSFIAEQEGDLEVKV